MFWHKQIIAKLYWWYSFATMFCSETVLGVCFGYIFHMPRHTPGIFVPGGICLPVTPVNAILRLDLTSWFDPDPFNTRLADKNYNHPVVS